MARRKSFLEDELPVLGIEEDDDVFHTKARLKHSRVKCQTFIKKAYEKAFNECGSIDEDLICDFRPNLKAANISRHQLQAAYEDAIHRVTLLLQDARNLRKQTTHLASEFAVMENQVARLSQISRRVEGTAFRYIEEMGDVIYLNSVIDHLQEAARTMVLVPFFVKT